MIIVAKNAVLTLYWLANGITIGTVLTRYPGWLFFAGVAISFVSSAAVGTTPNAWANTFILIIVLAGILVLAWVLSFYFQVSHDQTRLFNSGCEALTFDRQGLVKTWRCPPGIDVNDPSTWTD
jgi:hypothetical protein